MNIAAHAGVRVIATTRNPRAETLKTRAEEVVLEGLDLAQHVRDRCPEGVDAGLEQLGNSTVVASLTMVRFHGHL